MELVLATKTSLEAAVEAENWAEAFRLAKEIAAQFPPNTPVATWVCDLIGWQWGDEGKAKAEALFILPAVQPPVERREIVTKAELQAKRVADRYIGKDGSAPAPQAEPNYEYNKVEEDLKSAQARIAELEAKLANQSSPELPKALPKALVKSARALAQQIEPEGEFEFSANRPKRSLGNTRLAVQRLGLVCSYNKFQDRYLVDTEEGSIQLSDNFCVTLRETVHDKFGFDPGKEFTREIVVGRCLDNSFNPVTDYLTSLEWDGVSRLDEWPLRCLGGIEDTPLVRSMGRKFVCALVRRAFNPGCKFDHILVLEGAQDIGKSSLLKAFVGGVGEEYFSDQTILDVRDKEQQELTRGRWVYEIAELTGIRKAETEKIKAFVSRQVDRCRPAYGRFVVDQPRTVVFAGSTNDQEYLLDQTGNRRWWPIGWITSVDVGWLVENRDQIFAEAVALEPNEPLFLSVDLVPQARALQESRRAKHPWEDVLSSFGYLDSKPRYAVKVADEWRIHTRDIFANILQIDKGHLQDHHNKKLSQVMQKLGWTKPLNSIRITAKGVASGYVKKEPAIEGPKGV